jgi:hypothetical protein
MASLCELRPALPMVRGRVSRRKGRRGKVVTSRKSGRSCGSSTSSSDDSAEDDDVDEANVAIQATAMAMGKRPSIFGCSVGGPSNGTELRTWEFRLFWELSTFLIQLAVGAAY